ncbi:putative siderophore-interacting protein [Gordonia effusa NBRC 100432]|uniref:Putative siderophore-interacting protein n=1 Tax=Gordonia effusa NBRC 100432 TaxID=1077974 RepID=H0R3I6_9ACTN|nr:siderophore-interacting protein [Gordonia effusa]GAB19637.1 putative siderophore-interacting protein [Gordonia effusa NBRC 100432]
MKWPNFVGTLKNCDPVAANLLRARFEIGSGLADGYEPLTAGDEAVALYLSDNGVELRARVSEDSQALGGWEVADPERGVGHRNYTVREYDARTREMIIDVAVHPHGPAIDWFRAAQPGWRLLMAGPRSWYDPPPDATRHILAADLSALPALARILAATPDHIPVTVLAEVLDRSELDYLSTRPNVELIEVLGSGNGVAPTRLSSRLAKLSIVERDYVWLSGEASDTRAAKKQLRALGLTRDRYDIIGYWREDSERWSRRFEERGDEFRKVFDDAISSGASADEATELFEDALERAGL